MFRKLVSNLAFSPALVGQLGFYAKRLKKEEATRRIGLVFTALALVLQSFAVFSPPEAANAASGNDFVSGGVTSKAQYLSNYDRNNNNIKDIFNAVGITRAEIAAASENKYIKTGSTNPTYLSWGRQSRFSASQGEKLYRIPVAPSGTTSINAYARPTTLYNSYNAKVMIGYSQKVGWFALMYSCGNLVTVTYPPIQKCPVNYTGLYPNCTAPPKMCTVPGKEMYPANDPRCKADPVAKCESLRITKLADNYHLAATASTSGGATINGYVYTIKKDGVVVKTQTVTTSSSTNTYVYNTSAQGAYTVTLTVKTSIGDKTGPECAKTFNIPAPEMCPQNPKLTKDSPECQPCPGDPTLWIKDEQCAAKVIETKIAANTTQNNIDATTSTAKSSDRIVYTLEVANHGKAPEQVTIVEKLDDVLEYATLLDNGGGVYNDTDKTLTWPVITLNPGQKQTRLFTVQVLGTIPAMGTGVSDPASYDCRMTNTFGNSVDVMIDCPIEKQIVEQTVSELPHTGPTENMIFAGATLATVAYFYARSRQLKKEVRLIRRDINMGTI